MPRKLATSATIPSFVLPEVTVAVRTSRLFCGKAEKPRISKPVWAPSGESRLKAIKLRIAWKFTLIAFCLLSTTDCSRTAFSYSKSDPGLAPDYRRIVLRDLQAGRSPITSGETTKDEPATPDRQERSIFLNVERLGSVEISGVSQVRHPTKGLVWLTCIRSYPEGRLSTDYAIFIRDNKIVDARNSIVPDACAKQQYLPLIVIPPPRGRSTIY